jgi:hypothetical protein
MQINRMLAPIVLCTLVGLALAPSLRSFEVHAQPNAAFTFGAAGDFTDGSNFQATANAVQALKPEFFLALGDLSYKVGGEENWCGYWKSIGFTNLLLIAGNHDTDESRGGNIVKYMEYCGNPFKKLITGPYGRQYHFDYPVGAPLARFIMVTPGIGGDTGGLDTNYAVNRQGYKFTAGAIDDARAKGIKWIVVGMHKLYINTLEKHKNDISTDANATFMTMLLDKRVDVILQGHEHGYERTKQLATNPKTCPIVPTNDFDADCVVNAGPDLVKGAGSVVQIIGSGGKDMRTLKTGDKEFQYFVNKFAHHDLAAFGFGSFAVTANQLTFKYVRSAGPAFEDAYTITAPKQP